VHDRTTLTEEFLVHLPARLAAILTGLVAAVTIAAPAHAAVDTVEVANVAHRGASAYAPENTLAAVREGIAMDGDLIEVDVQRTRDGELVLIHDTNLARTTDVEQVFPERAPWKVADFTYAEMLSLDAGSWKASEYVGEKIPTLAEAIDVIRPSRAGLLLEIKAPELYPGTPATAQLAELATWADQVNPHHRSVGAAYVAAVHNAGMDCLVWTVDGVADMNRAIDMGVDGVITNRPDVLEQVLRDRLPAAA
jgi:glycerophosphoryl diester phosphodiesterase